MSEDATRYSRAPVWDAIDEIAGRWKIPRESARMFLAGGGYFAAILSHADATADRPARPSNEVPIDPSDGASVKEAEEANPITDGGCVADGREVEHTHDVGDTLTKIDSSEWKVTTRMVDVDSGDPLYRLREADGDFSEIMTESQVSQSFHEGDCDE